MSKTIACIIPARLASTRFPRKILASIRGKPILQWVWEAAHRSEKFDQITFAIDAPETAALIESFGGKYHYTDVACRSGTDRLVELQKNKVIEADIWVNWQGDEPFIHRAMIEDLLRTSDDSFSDIWTLKRRIGAQEALSPQLAKVVCDATGHALYFSRSPIPFYRDPCPEEKKIFHKHIGIYAYTDAALRRIATLPPSPLEEAEQLEQLRFLTHGLRLRVHETEHDAFGIDLPEHLAQAETQGTGN